MAVLLTTDPELVRRRLKEFDRHLLFEAARRVIRTDHLPSEVDENGEPTAYAVDRLVRGFPYFSFDDPNPDRGWDGGLWFS